MAKFLFISFSVALFSLGCTAQYTKSLTRSTLDNTQAFSSPRITRQHTWVLAANTRLYLAFPSMPTQAPPKPLPRTQHQLAQVLAEQFGRHFPATQATLQEAPLKTLFTQAAREHCAILVVPSLEDLSQNPYANTTTTEKPEKNHLWLNLNIYDVGSQRLLDTLKISHQQGWADWRTQEPSALFESAVGEGVKGLVAL